MRGPRPWLLALLWPLAFDGAAADAADRVTLPLVEVAAGVFLHEGVQETAAPGNLGAIANIGFVVGERCVAVVDSGGSLKEGLALREAIKARTALPICYVINTHGHPDHVFGNAAFLADKPRFVGHVKLPLALAAREPGFLRALQRDLGDSATGSSLVPPDTLVSDVLELDLGRRKLTLRAWKTAHTDNDITVYDEKTGTLWLGDLLFVERIPVVDGSLRGWLGVIQDLRGMHVAHAIPGHGAAQNAWPAPLDAEDHYLHALADEVRTALRKRLTLQQAVDTVAVGERGNWLLFDDYNKRNVTAAYAELEWED